MSAPRFEFFGQVMVRAVDYDASQQLVKNLVTEIELAIKTLWAGDDGVGGDWSAKDAAEVVLAAIRKAQGEG